MAAIPLGSSLSAMAKLDSRDFSAQSTKLFLPSSSSHAPGSLHGRKFFGGIGMPVKRRSEYHVLVSNVATGIRPRNRITRTKHNPSRRLPFKIRASQSAGNEAVAATATNSAAATTTTATTPPKPKRPVYSMKKGQIVKVDKEKYLNSINYLSVGHPPFYKGLDYIYEDRGEVLDIRIFETGEYALIGWVGIPTAPAWLPTDMLIKADKLDYERI